MLKKFVIENFKNFKTRFAWDLSHPGSYEFSKACIHDGVVSKGAIYGINGIGKSNLGRALFDIVNNLTDKVKETAMYVPFLNLNAKKNYASFEYEFQFYDSILIYRYKKSNLNTLLEESLLIDDKELLYYDYRERKGFSNFLGSENLNLDDASSISRVKYIMNSAILDDTDKYNRVLKAFKDFVNGMLLFYSLRNNGFIGFRDHGESVEDVIIKAGKLKDFEEFLNASGLHLSLIEKEDIEGKKIYVRYQNGDAPYFNVASTGMVSLILLYSWLISLDQCSFVFIDEFDAFYHYELAEAVVKELMKHHNTQIFVTTHNTDLMSNDLLRPDTYFILTEESIKSLQDCTDRDLRFAHNLQKMYKAHAFEKIDE